MGWRDAGGYPQLIYEEFGLPDATDMHVGVYGYQFGFEPQFVDPFLGEGGLLLDHSDFIDMTFSLAGVTSIARATLGIYGRSFDTTASGSFNWQTFSGVGSTDDDFVSNVAPYNWYTWEFSDVLDAGDDGVLLRIKSGPSSDSLVVNRVEICMVAE